LAETLVVVTSKSGGTPETRNGMIEVRAAYEAAGLEFARHAVAITGVDSQLDKVAVAEGWITRFPMADWVGGRTSVMSVVGLIPAALQGVDVDAFLAGARAMDQQTRRQETRRNPAMMLALMWHHAGNGRGEKDMVVLPYKDRLVLFSKYLQQLVMESLGKEFELGNEKRVCQGLAVYGNKGSTDQHAYVQQLRDGVNNFFAVFLEVRQDRSGASMVVDASNGATSGDYLQGFLRGTRAALSGNGRQSMTLSVPVVDAFHLGALIGLFERAVTYYASLVNINAYHQPGVEAGKKAAGAFLSLMHQVRGYLLEQAGNAISAEQCAQALTADPENVHHILVHLSANGAARMTSGAGPAEDRFTA
jgi:glucose-6-phosphate isomerase